MPNLANYLLSLPESFDEDFKTELVIAEPSRIVIESDIEPSLDQMLTAFDPLRHGGELLADAPCGGEAFA